MKVKELQDRLDDYHKDLQVVIRSDLGDTVEDFVDFSTGTTEIDGETVVVLLF